MTSAQTLLDLHLEVCRQFDETRYMTFRQRFHELEHDTDVAKRLIRLCLASPDAGAMGLLGLCHQNGYGTRRNESIAIDWYRKGSAGGDSTAMFLLGSLLSKGSRGEVTEAMGWFRKSTDLGNPLAMNALGRCHQDGVGVPKDRVKAMDWYQRAVDHGVRGARFNVALLHLLGDDDLAGARYLADAHRATTDPTTRSECEDWLPKSLPPHVIATLALRWRGLEVENEALKADDQAHRARIEALEAENEALRTELDYRPGGPGYTEARTEFASLASGIAEGTSL